MAIPTIPGFPLDVEAIVKHSFSGLTTDEAEPEPEPAKEGESAASEDLRKKKEEQKKARAEKRKEAKEKALAKIKETIKQKLKEISSSLETITLGTTEVATQAPKLFQTKAFLIYYDVTYLKALEAQVTVMKAQAALGPAPGSAPALAASTLAELEATLDMAKQNYEAMKTQYDGDVANLKTRISEIKDAETLIESTCGLLLIGSLPVVIAFFGGLKTAVDALDSAVSVL